MPGRSGKQKQQEETPLFNFATNRDRDRSERRGRKRRDNFVEATHEEDSGQGEGGGGLDSEGIQGSAKRCFLGCVKRIDTVRIHATQCL